MPSGPAADRRPPPEPALPLLTRACLHDRPLPDALKLLSELGLTGAEINAGGFVPAPHLPIDQIRSG